MGWAASEMNFDLDFLLKRFVQLSPLSLTVPHVVRTVEAGHLLQFISSDPCVQSSLLGAGGMLRMLVPRARICHQTQIVVACRARWALLPLR